MTQITWACKARQFVFASVCWVCVVLMPGYSARSLAGMGLATIVLGGLLAVGSVLAAPRNGNKIHWIYPAGALGGSALIFTGAAIGAGALPERNY